MNSKERRELRYQRRSKRRSEKREKSIKDLDAFESVFTYENLYKSYQQCRKNVKWKSSTQKFMAQAPLEVCMIKDRLHKGKWKTKGFYEFEISERGKIRNIKSVHISERVIQKCLCDYSLTPMLSRSFIFDNGASTKNKGYHFAIQRCEKHLHDYYRKYGNDGYILTFDFKKFFENIDHVLIHKIVDENYSDQKLKNLIFQLTDIFGEKGLGLGSQVSQIFALASGNRLDHYCKEVLRIHGYARYMDDGYLIHPSKEYLKECLVKIKVLCDEMGIVLNEKKTNIVKLSHGFTFLKCRFYLTDTGKVIKKMNKESIVHERRKLKKLCRKYLNGNLSREDLEQSFQSWIGYAKHFDSYKTIKSMEDVYNSYVPDRINNRKNKNELKHIVVYSTSIDFDQIKS